MYLILLKKMNDLHLDNRRPRKSSEIQQGVELNLNYRSHLIKIRPEVNKKSPVLNGNVSFQMFSVK